MPLQATSGAASYDAFGGGVPVVPAYIEEVFSTYLWTGNGSTQTITNGIDLSGKGGLTWIKRRNAVRSHQLFDTVRGATKILYSDLTNAQDTDTTSLTSFNSDGFSLGLDGGGNANGGTYASWTFRKQPKFFDVVTYTGNGTAGRTVSHNLGSVPGCIIIKSTTRTSDWVVYHQSVGTSATLILNSTVASANYGNNISSITSSSFNVTGGSDSNANGDSYVAYIFASNAGGFGLTGSDNVITCDSYVGNGSATGPEIDLGYEPQWLLIKRTADAGYDWFMWDTMRGLTSTGASNKELYANLTSAEQSATGMGINARGFQPLQNAGGYNANGKTYIYIAIRRGPMKVPTDATKVFTPALGNGSVAPAFTSGFPVDLGISKIRDNTFQWAWSDRLRGNTTIGSASTDAETGPFAVLAKDYMTGWGNGTISARGSNYCSWMFQRAPSFFDVVCDTGTGVTKTVSHNLTVAPELIIRKSRSDGTREWVVYSAALGATQRIFLNLTNASDSSSGTWNDTAPTSSVFTVGSNNNVNGSGQTFITYLFATLAGVSKVGSYTGDGTNGRVIDCGFTSGARFILIKKTNSTGDWAVWDTARGITSGNDPVLAFNSTAAEYVDGDQVDPSSTGFIVNNVGGFNTSGDTYIFLAIA